MAWIPPLTVAPLPGSDAFDAPFSSGGETSDPAVEALDRLGQSYGDEVTFLQSQLAPSSGAYDAAGADPAAQLEQTLGGLLGAEDVSGRSADEQLLADALPATPLDLYA